MIITLHKQVVGKSQMMILRQQIAFCEYLKST